MGYASPSSARIPQSSDGAVHGIRPHSVGAAQTLGPMATGNLGGIEPQWSTSGTGPLQRASSANAASSPRRKPVPSHLPPTAEISPFPTLAPSKEPPLSLPFSTPRDDKLSETAEDTQNPTQARAAHLAPPPKRELVPLLGVPEGPIRIAGHETHYVTKTTKARWDGMFF